MSSPNANTGGNDPAHQPGDQQQQQQQQANNNSNNSSTSSRNEGQAYSSATSIGSGGDAAKKPVMAVDGVMALDDGLTPNYPVDIPSNSSGSARDKMDLLLHERNYALAPFAAVAALAEEERARPEPATCVGRALRKGSDFLDRVVPPGGHISNIFNFASGTLGIAITSMASGFNTAGIVLSVILMILCGALVVFSFYLIGKTVELSRYQYDSWELATRNLFFRGADYVLSVIMIFFQFGSMIGFVVATHELVGPFLDDESVTGILSTPNGHRLLTATVWFFGMFLLCIPRRVASLRYFSIVGVSFVIFFVFAVVARSSIAGLPHVHEMKLVGSGLDAINGLSLFIFAFLNHGLSLRMAKEAFVFHTKRRVRAVGVEAAAAEPMFRSGRMLAIDTACSVSLVATLYFIVGFFGYAYVGPSISGSIFKYFDVRRDGLMCAAYIGVLLKICVAYALTTQAARLPIYYLLRSSVDDAPWWLNLILTATLCVLSFVIGVFVPDSGIVFNLLGSIFGGLLAFLMPVFFVCYIGGWTLKNVGVLRYAVSIINLIVGVVAIVFGTAVTIHDTVQTYG